MPRRFYLQLHLTNHEFRERHRHAHYPVERTHWYRSLLAMDIRELSRG